MSQPRRTTPPSRESGGNALLEALRPQVHNAAEEQKNLLRTQLQGVALKGLRGLKGGEAGKTSAAQLLHEEALRGVEEGAGEDEAQAADVRRHADELTKQAGAVDATLRSKANSLAHREADSHQETLETAAEGAVPNQTDTSPKAKQRGLKAAAKAATKKRKALYKESRRTLASTIEADSDALLGNLQTRARGKGRTQAKREARLRGQHDARLGTMAEAPVHKAVKEIKASTSKYLAHKLGASSAHWWRSKEVRLFRGGVKEEARHQGQTDVDEELSHHSELGPMRKKHARMDSRRRVHKAAKGSVKTAVTGIAQGAAAQLVDQGGAAATLKTAAVGGAWDRMRVHPEDEAAAAKAAVKATRGAKKGVEREVLADAKAWKNRVLGKSEREGDQDRGQGVELTEGALKTRVRDQTSEDEVGKKAVNASLQASSIEEGLGKIGRLLDVAAPSSGDTAGIKVSLQVPIPNSPAFLMIGFAGAAARGIATLPPGSGGSPPDTALKVSATLKFGAGVKLVLGKAAASVSLTQRANAGTTAEAMRVFSYGAYRRLATGKTKKLSGLWGGSGKGTDTKRAERAELWAATVEEEIFAKDGSAYVETGKAAGVEAQAGTGSLGLKASLTNERYRRLDRESLTGAGILSHNEEDDSYSVRDVTSDEDARARRGLTKAGVAKTTKKVAVASVPVMLPMGKTTLQGKLTFWDKGKWTVEASATLGLKTGTKAKTLDKVAGRVAAGAVSLAQLLAARNDHQEDNQGQSGRNVGRAARGLSGIDAVSAGLKTKAASGLAGAAGGEPKPKASLSLGVSVFLGKKGGAWFTQVVLTQKTAHTLDLDLGPLGGLKVDVEQSHRLGGGGYDGTQDEGSRVNGEVLGNRGRR